MACARAAQVYNFSMCFGTYSRVPQTYMFVQIFLTCVERASEWCCTSGRSHALVVLIVVMSWCRRRRRPCLLFVVCCRRRRPCLFFVVVVVVA